MFINVILDYLLAEGFLTEQLTNFFIRKITKAFVIKKERSKFSF